MASLSTHTLNSVDGTHAADVGVSLTRIDAAGRRVVLSLYPIDRVDGASSVSPVNIVLLSLMVVGFALSLWRRRNAPD